MTENDNDYRDVLDQLSILAPQEEDVPAPAGQALGQVRRTLYTRKRSWFGGSKRNSSETMNKRVFAIGATAVLAFALLLVGFPSVRAAASDFLGLFRVEKFAPISISPQQLALLDQLESEGLNPGEMVMVKEPGEPEQVSSLEEAEDRTGYRIRTLDDILGDPEVYVTSDARGHLIVDLAGARAIVEAVGVDPLLLPDSLDGAPVEVNVYPSVQQVFVNGTTLMQTPSPEVNYPEDVDPTVLGEALLQVLGMDADSARQMAQSIDWTSTMLLPIPREFATYSQIDVDGASGVAITPVDGSSEAAVMWQKGGTVFVLSGPFGVGELISVANSLR